MCCKYGQPMTKQKRVDLKVKRNRRRVRFSAKADGVEFQANCSRLLGCMKNRGNDGMEGEIAIMALVEDNSDDSTAGNRVLPDPVSDAGGKLWKTDEVTLGSCVGRFCGRWGCLDVCHGCIDCFLRELFTSCAFRSIVATHVDIVLYRGFAELKLWCCRLKRGRGAKRTRQF